MTTEYKKPLPRPLSTELTKPFWEAAKRHELAMPRCQKCDKFFFYPREECPRCASQDLGCRSAIVEPSIPSMGVSRAG